MQMNLIISPEKMLLAAREDGVLSPLPGKFLKACLFYFPVIPGIKPSIVLYLIAITVILRYKKMIK